MKSDFPPALRFSLRRARPEDARAIHESHMSSIRELCGSDYPSDVIAGWGGRAFNENERLRGIREEYVWVVEIEGSVEGHGHFAVLEEGGERFAYIRGFYFAPRAAGMGLGRKLMDLMLAEIRALAIPKVTLESTLTSLEFYKKLGFRSAGPERLHPVAGVEVRCIPMVLEL